MKWFEERKAAMAGSDGEAHGKSYNDIVDIADRVLDGETMTKFVRETFLFQRSFGEFLGVGESTVTGWMKTGSFPDYAKRATLAAYYATNYFRELEEARREAHRPKVVKDGDRYMIVQFEKDEVGVTEGTVLAREIPTRTAAHQFVGFWTAWDLLDEATTRVIENELDASEDGSSYQELLEDLSNRIREERARTFSPVDTSDSREAFDD